MHTDIISKAVIDYIKIQNISFGNKLKNGWPDNYIHKIPGSLFLSNLPYTHTHTQSKLWSDPIQFKPYSNPKPWFNPNLGRS